MVQVAIPTEESWAAACDVARTLRRAGFQVFAVGGCVRDLLLGRPAHDVDLATDAAPDQIEKLFPRTIDVGKAFGVIRVVTADPATPRPRDSAIGAIEVATFRAETGYGDARRPDAVRFGDIEADVARRDFTVNALYLDLEDGRVHDRVGGLADLEARRLRAVGQPERRFSEDRLRVLRALRFAAVLGFALEPATAAALPGIDCSPLARERVLDELAKATNAAGAFLRLCAAHQQVAAVAPCADAERAAIILDRLGPVPMGLALTAWLLPGGTDAARAWVAMQPIEARWRRAIPWLIRTVAILDRLPVADRRRALQTSEGPALAALAAAVAPDKAADYMAWAAQEALAETCPISARDLLAAGWQPGPALGAALRRAEDAWLRDATLATAALLHIARHGDDSDVQSGQ